MYVCVLGRAQCQADLPPGDHLHPGPRAGAEDSGGDCATRGPGEGRLPGHLPEPHPQDAGRGQVGGAVLWPGGVRDEDGR